MVAGDVRHHGDAGNLAKPPAFWKPEEPRPHFMYKQAAKVSFLRASAAVSGAEPSADPRTARTRRLHISKCVRTCEPQPIRTRINRDTIPYLHAMTILLNLKIPRLTSPTWLVRDVELIIRWTNMVREYELPSSIVTLENTQVAKTANPMWQQ